MYSDTFHLAVCVAFVPEKATTATLYSPETGTQTVAGLCSKHTWSSELVSDCILTSCRPCRVPTGKWSPILLTTQGHHRTIVTHPVDRTGSPQDNGHPSCWPHRVTAGQWSPILLTTQSHRRTMVTHPVDRTGLLQDNGHPSCWPHRVTAGQWWPDAGRKASGSDRTKNQPIGWVVDFTFYDGGASEFYQTFWSDEFYENQCVKTKLNVIFFLLQNYILDGWNLRVGFLFSPALWAGDIF